MRSWPGRWPPGCAEGMAVDVAPDGEDALGRTLVNRYDVLVLDRDLPRLHGDDVCRDLVAEARRDPSSDADRLTDRADRVEGFSIGADDYLPKPFDYAELLARIRALARRAPSRRPPSSRTATCASTPPGGSRVRAGQRAPLTRKELAVLEHLLAAQGRPVPAEELLEQVWDEAADPFTSTVKTTIRRLRAKLGNPPVIEMSAKAATASEDPSASPPSRACPDAPPGCALPSCAVECSCSGPRQCPPSWSSPSWRAWRDGRGAGRSPVRGPTPMASLPHKLQVLKMKELLSYPPST